jgi:hypothetical protein
MARNFQIFAKESRNQFLTLQLYGDFDAASACELINFLGESVKKSRKGAINFISSAQAAKLWISWSKGTPVYGQLSTAPAD